MRKTSSDMIDTLRLKFPYEVPNNHPFFCETVGADELRIENTPTKWVKTNQKWRTAMKAGGNYIPKYWIEPKYTDPTITYFVLEFSAAKLVYGNSIDQVTQDDLPLIVHKLLEFLKAIDVHQITASRIYNTVPLVVAIGKNIDVTPICSAELAIKALEPYNYRPRSRSRTITFTDTDFGGSEVHFGNRQSSFKVYSKIPEVANNAVTSQEKTIAHQLQEPQYKLDPLVCRELLRAELTLKQKQSVIQKFKPYLGTREATLQNIFDDAMLFDILAKEIESIYTVSVAPLLFLAQWDQPLIDAFLNRHVKHTTKKYIIRGLLQDIQSKGLAQTRKEFLKEYARSTWYRHMELMEGLLRVLPLKTKLTSNMDVVRLLLTEFGVETQVQTKLL